MNFEEGSLPGRVHSMPIMRAISFEEEGEKLWAVVECKDLKNRLISL